MTSSMSSRVLLCLRVGILAGFTWIAVSGRFPPAHAQSDSPSVLSEKVSELNKHLEATDGRVDKQWTKVNALENDAAHMNGMIAGFGFFLTVLTGVSITIQVRKKA